jgi:hypothetical protein
MRRQRATLADGGGGRFGPTAPNSAARRLAGVLTRPIVPEAPQIATRPPLSSMPLNRADKPASTYAVGSTRECFPGIAGSPPSFGRQALCGGKCHPRCHIGPSNWPARFNHRVSSPFSHGASRFASAAATGLHSPRDIGRETRLACVIDESQFAPRLMGLVPAATNQFPPHRLAGLVLW